MSSEQQHQAEDRKIKLWSVTVTLSGREHVRVATDIHFRYFWHGNLVTEELE